RSYPSLETAHAYDLEHELCKAQVVIDDQQHPVAWMHIVPVIAHFVDRLRRLFGLRFGSAHGRYDRDRAIGYRRGLTPGLGSRERLGNIEREGASLARSARQPDLTAQEPREFTADGRTKARAAILASRAAIGLLECR